MPAPLLETKLYLPRPRQGLVPRPRLSERLDRGSTAKLMLVSAPAGFGKTSLLASWLAEETSGSAAAWLSLDRGDNDPTSFWTYVIAALRTVLPGIGAAELEALASPAPPAIPLVLTTLLNDVGASEGEIRLVLDDYHVIDSREISEQVAFLLEHLPPQLHLVVVSRADPAVPLARLRARGDLVEIRAADLRFRPEEAVAYLNGVMGLQLTAQDVAALEERTEGWVAALQLAALSMQGRDDTAGFIAAFTGDDRYIVDYLMEEVVQRQDEEVRAFLLRTSVLDRLDGPVCDAVTGQGNGRARLEALDRGNLFLVPLDDRRRQYRYHHLFGDMLRARLLDEQAELVPDLHRRAGAWYQRHGDAPAAIRHSLAAEDFGTAADLVEQAMPAMRRGRQEAALRRWLEALPDTLVRTRPVLIIGYVGALLSTGEVEGVEEHLRDAEQWLTRSRSVNAGPEAPATGVADDEELTWLAGWVAVYRAGHAMALGDAVTTVAHAAEARRQLPDDDELGQGAADALTGIASWVNGELEAAHRAYTDCTVRMNRAGHVADVLGCSITLADIRIVQGRPREAMRTYERALELATAGRGPVLRGTADMYVGMSALHRERGDQQVARELLLRSQELGEHKGLPQNAYRWRVAMARIREADGDLEGALDLLDEAEERYVADFAPNVRPVPAYRARVQIAQGRLDEAFGWAREHGLSVEDRLSYLREFEHVTLARALLARYRSERAKPALQDAVGLLERLLQAADAGSRAGSAIEILALQALGHQLRGDVGAALVPLERALCLAEPEGYLRIFVDEGSPMLVLLEAAARHQVAPGYVGRLLSALGGTRGPTAASASASAEQGLVQPLSERELAVLRLLGGDLSGPGIARELTVSLNTVRTHTQNAYAKLGVNNRRAAVRRAAELGLLSNRPR